MFTHTANPSAYTMAKNNVIPNFKSNATPGDISSVKIVLFLMLNIVITLQLYLILARVVTLVLTSAKPNISLVLATVNLTVNLNCKS